jgi:hypothetical protein
MTEAARNSMVCNRSQDAITPAHAGISFCVHWKGYSCIPGCCRFIRKPANVDSRVPSPSRERARVRVKNFELPYSIGSASLMNRYPLTLTLSPNGRGNWFLRPFLNLQQPDLRE